MVETATLLSAADDYAVVELAGRKVPGMVVRADSARTILAQLTTIRALAEKRGNAERAAEIEDICGLFAEISRKVVSACESPAIELRYPQNGRRVDTPERES